ncbi:hypothetical protein Dda_7234 [Drechslerella dactyloides]|uniref:Uncharacterized protein n=1 Tax=Drechslerella dactyloides TaxID=74499 RepID=A0AAD6IRV5_DREDA|nr:hypothetical protein Dda_7234 [Drechslerella dactyloides]
MVGRQRPKRGRGGRRPASRSPANDDMPPPKPVAATRHSPLGPPPPPSGPQRSPETPPRSPQSSGSPKRKFEDIEEVSWEDNNDKNTTALSFSLDASIRSTSDRPSRRLRSSYTLAASVTSIERATRARSHRAATLERSVTRNPLSSGFSKPNDSEKLVVKSRDGRECWLCAKSNTVMLETAHNVVASNRDLFLNYRDTVGIFPPNLRHLASPHNLVTLCRNCHCVYDCQQPRWIILPTNIQFFIDHETSDYEYRLVASAKGVIKPRTVPTALEYSTAAPTNLYMPYFFEESVMPRMDPEQAESRFPRPYGGAPTTMILKAGLGINQPKIKASKNASLPFSVGIPPAVRQQVTHLFELWDRDPPSPKKRASSPKPPAKEDHPSPGSDTDDDSQTGPRKQKRTNIRKRKSPHASQPPAEDHQDELADICAPTKKKARIMGEPQDPIKDISPVSQGTATHTAGRNSQVSTGRRYNLRSHYRTPPTSPEFDLDTSPRKATGNCKDKRKMEAITTDTGIQKRKRISTSSESVLATKARKLAKATSRKKDGKKTKKKSKGQDPRAHAPEIPLTPRSRHSPNDPISKMTIASLVKASSGVKKVRLEDSRMKQSIKRNTAALFADVADIASARKPKVSAGIMANGEEARNMATRSPKRLPPAEFDVPIKQSETNGEFDTSASNLDSLDAQSGGDGDDDFNEHDDGYASDSGSERPDKEDWAWGPSHTANDVVNMCVGWFGVGTSGRIGE